MLSNNLVSEMLTMNIFLEAEILTDINERSPACNEKNSKCSCEGQGVKETKYSRMDHVKFVEDCL